MRPDILTRSGIYFDLVNPTPDMVRVEDIAHALSNCARFAGHTSRFYSVAQHSVYVSHVVPTAHALQGLLHDAAEAYIGDMTAPLKRLVPQFKEVEDRIWRAIAARFGVPELMHPSVKEADMTMLATEQRDLMAPHDDVWACLRNVSPLVRRITAWTPEESMFAWTARLEEIERQAETERALTGAAA